MEYCTNFVICFCTNYTLDFVHNMWYNFNVKNNKGGIDMPIMYKIDILQALKDKGYSTYKLRKEKIFGEATIQKFRTGGHIDLEVLERLCSLLNCQPGDILEYVEED